MYRLATIQFITDRQTDRQTAVSCQRPIMLRAAIRSAQNHYSSTLAT